MNDLRQTLDTTKPASPTPLMKPLAAPLAAAKPAPTVSPAPIVTVAKAISAGSKIPSSTHPSPLAGSKPAPGMGVTPAPIAMPTSLASQRYQEADASRSPREGARTSDAVRNAQFELAQVQPGGVQPPPPAPGPALQPQPAGPAISPLPAGSPFEAIAESGTLTLRVRRSMLMRTKVDIYRTAVVDEAICDIVQFTPREVSLIGRAPGHDARHLLVRRPGHSRR